MPLMSASGTTHESYARNEVIKTSSNRSFGIVFTVVFAIVGVWPLISGGELRQWSAIVAGVLLIVSFVRPVWLAPANRFWMRFGLLLHKITNPIIMGLVFYLAVTPTALIMRLLGKDPLTRKIDPEAESYWIDRKPPGPAPNTMTNQF